MGELREKYRALLGRRGDFRQTVCGVAALLHRDFACDRVSLFFKDRYGVFVSVMAEGLEGMDLSFKPGEGLVGKCVLHKQPVVANDPLHNPQALSRVRDHYTGYQTQSLLAAPILNFWQRPVGAVQLINKLEGGFNDHDAGRLTEIAGALAPLGRRLPRPLANIWTRALAAEMAAWIRSIS